MLKKISDFGLGTYQFSGKINLFHQGKEKIFGHPPIEKKDIQNILSYCQENKINLLDTAPFYGEAEKKIGELLPQRKNWHILTNLGCQIMIKNYPFLTIAKK